MQKNLLEELEKKSVENVKVFRLLHFTAVLNTFLFLYFFVSKCTNEFSTINFNLDSFIPFIFSLIPLLILVLLINKKKLGGYFVFCLIFLFPYSSYML